MLTLDGDKSKRILDWLCYMTKDNSCMNVKLLPSFTEISRSFQTNSEKYMSYFQMEPIYFVGNKKNKNA